MSGHYRASLENIAECNEVCDIIAARLCELDSMIKQIEKNSSNIMDESTSSAIAYLKRSKKDILSQINSIKAKISVNMGANEYTIAMREARVSLRSLNELISFRVEAIRKELSSSLFKRIEDQTNEVLNKKAIKRENLDIYLAKIDDEGLQNLVRIMCINPDNNSLSLDEIKVRAVRSMDPKTIDKNELRRLKQKIRDELETNKVDKAEIEKVLGAVASKEDILEIQEKADALIIGERVRKSTIKSVISCIRDKGFIVEKSNIRFLEDKNQVKILALKPGGQRAEFVINLDGTFIYKFDDYEGQACQKDMQPFMDDLESIYGIKLKDIHEDWANPDKESTMKYQTYKVNRGG